MWILPEPQNTDAEAPSFLSSQEPPNPFPADFSFARTSLAFCPGKTEAGLADIQKRLRGGEASSGHTPGGPRTAPGVARARATKGCAQQGPTGWLRGSPPPLPELGRKRAESPRGRGCPGQNARGAINRTALGGGGVLGWPWDALLGEKKKVLVLARLLAPGAGGGEAQTGELGERIWFPVASVLNSP